MLCACAFDLWKREKKNKEEKKKKNISKKKNKKRFLKEILKKERGEDFEE